MNKHSHHSHFFHDVLSAQWRQMTAGQRNVLASDDAEALHDLRVALLRVNFALKLLGHWIETRHLRDEFQRVCRIMGRARNLDLLASDIVDDFKKVRLPDRQQRAVRRRIRSQRLDSRRQLVRELKSPRYQAMVAELESLMKETAKLRPPQHRGRLVRKSLKNVVQWQKQRLHSEDLHKIRIAFKELRYTVEFVSAFDHVRMDKAMRAIIKFQNLLGQRQDAISAEEILTRMNIAPARRLVKMKDRIVRRSERKFKHRWKKSLPKLSRNLKFPS